MIALAHRAVRFSGLKALLCALVLAFSCSAWAKFDWSASASEASTPQVRVQLLAYAPDGVSAGAQVWIGLQITHQAQWHTYWSNSGDSGQATQLQWRLPQGMQAGALHWPVPKKIWIGSLANYGYEDTVLLPTPLVISADFKADATQADVPIEVDASWLVCKQECIPQEAKLSLRLPLRSSTAVHKAAFESALQANPKDWASQASARIVGQYLEIAVPQLPPLLRGQSLELFPQTPDVLENGARLAAKAQAVASVVGGAQEGASWTQAWRDEVWTAVFPLSAQRSASPALMSLVLTADGKQAYRVQAQVQGQWPSVAAAAPLSAPLPAPLEQALKANAEKTGAAPSGQAEAALTALLPAALLALLGGMLLNLMPCVFPVLAIKLLSFANMPSPRVRAAGALAYGIGVVLSFVALGGLMLALRAGGQALGWGFQLQSPWVVAALALLFTLIALNLLGVLEVSHVLPSSLATWQIQNSTLNALLSGVLAVAIASPCTAPWMGAALGFALGLPAWEALTIFAALGLGMALPYMAVSVVPALARRIPRPGVWMDQFKKVMAFPMLGTVVWLLWVLGQQSGVDGAAAMLALLLGVAMLAWTLGPNRTQRRWYVTTAVCVCALLVWAFGPAVVKSQGVSGESSSRDAGVWQVWSPNRVEQALAQRQAVFVDFTAAWCVTCQLNKKTTLSNEAVLAEFAAKNVLLLRADWTRYDPQITQALTALGRSGVPVYVLYAPSQAPFVLGELLRPAQVQAALARLEQ